MATANSGWSTDRIRQTFLDYFASKDHRVIPSVSLIPTSPSTLLTGAGMQPLVPMFRGEEEPPAPRLASSQKCVRTGDIENVGRTARHHTFFEMLGNFAFGDYFKREAIEFCWELVTQGFELPPDALWATVYEEDDESWQLWHRHIGLPAHKVIRCGKKDNWWPQTVWNGPCGPCTEVYVDQGPGIYPCDNAQCGPECDCDRYLEIWNLVFQMYNQTEEGALSPLPTPGVDTGLGLERLAAVKQGVPTNFDIDIFRPMIAAIEAEAAATGHPFHYGDGPRTDQAVRVIVDHFRAIAFMMADTIMPSNKGRGYVLRRIVRRALRFARHLGLDDPFMFRLLPALIDTMGHVYPELTQRSNTIVASVRQEEERFCATLEQGIGILSGLVADAKAAGRSALPGEEVFRLYDTFGFPVEMTEEMAAEEGLTIEREGFEAALERQRSRSVFRFTESAAAKEFYVSLSRAHPASEYARDQAALADLRV
ncbi:MAG TPA: alanine--tRNA ligase, partial [Armatimonadota bacterium]|nr:alanine--tRNA ligase [Armatimonadota bacterium]